MRNAYVEVRLRNGEGHSHGNGAVKWFNEAKGYGFITPDDGGDDLFAHFPKCEQKDTRRCVRIKR